MCATVKSKRKTTYVLWMVKTVALFSVISVLFIVDNGDIGECAAKKGIYDVSMSDS